MNDREALAIYALLAAAHPAWKATDATVDLWVMMLADLDYGPARQAVLQMIATDTSWPSVARVRQAVAAGTGLLAPDVDLAWAEVTGAASRSRYDRVRPAWSHPAIVEAVAAVGGLVTVRDSDSPTVVAGQFARCYAAAAERHRTAVCAVGGQVSLPSHRSATLDQPPIQEDGDDPA